MSSGTLQVKLQSQPSLQPGAAPLYGGALDAIRKTLAGEGLRGLYKGMAAPLATVALFNAVMFATRGQMEQLLMHADGTCLASLPAFLTVLAGSLPASSSRQFCN